MNQLEVFVNKKSDSFKFIYGTSSSGKLIADVVKSLDVSSANDLLIKSLEVSDPEKTMIIINDNALTLLEPTKLLDALEYFITNVNYDVLFLTRYGDECKVHTDFRKYKDVEFMKVFSPFGIESLMISPSGKIKLRGKLGTIHGRGADFILNAMSEKMNNYSSSPPLFNINLSKRTDDSELVKGNICRESYHAVKPAKLSSRNSSITNLFWFILVLLFIFFLASSAMSLSDKQKNLYIDSDFVKTGIGPNDGTGDLKTYRID